MTEQDNTAERTEQVVAQIMRGARDEKIRLDTLVAEQGQLVLDLKQQITDLLARHDQRERETIHRHAEEVAKLADDRDRYLKRATQLETDLRSMVSILNDALAATQPMTAEDEQSLQSLRQWVRRGKEEDAA